MKRERGIKVFFTDTEYGFAEALRERAGMMNIPELVRALVVEAHRDTAQFVARYKMSGGSGFSAAPQVPRETIASKRKALLDLSDEDLTTKLKELGILEPAGYYDAPANTRGYDAVIGMGADGQRRVLFKAIDYTTIPTPKITHAGDGTTLEALLNSAQKNKKF